jgi:hypothetical protein
LLLLFFFFSLPWFPHVQANPGYEPALEASKLHAANVNVFAIGVGQSIDQGELYVPCSL